MALEPESALVQIPVEKDSRLAISTFMSAGTMTLLLDPKYSGFVDDAETHFCRVNGVEPNAFEAHEAEATSDLAAKEP
jgi:hypothetical protein